MNSKDELPVAVLGSRHFYDNEGPGDPTTLKNLEAFRQNPQPFIVVAHGYWKPEDALKGVVHAVLLVQSSGLPKPGDLAQLKMDLPDCGRIFPLILGKGWSDLTADQWRKTRKFLESYDAVPTEPELQRLLGFDLTVRRLTLQIAVSLAQEELTKPHPLDILILLAPAAALVRESDALKAEFPSLMRALDDAENANWPATLSDTILQMQN